MLLSSNNSIALQATGSLGLTSIPNNYFLDTKDLFKHNVNHNNYLLIIILLIYPRVIGPNYPWNTCLTRFATYIYIFRIYKVNPFFLTYEVNVQGNSSNLEQGYKPPQ